MLSCAGSICAPGRPKFGYKQQRDPNEINWRPQTSSETPEGARTEVVEKAHTGQ